MTALPQYALKYTCGHYRCGCCGLPLDECRRFKRQPFGWHDKEILSPCPACQPKPGRLRPIPYEEQPPVSGGLV